MTKPIKKNSKIRNDLSTILLILKFHNNYLFLTYTANTCLSLADSLFNIKLTILFLNFLISRTLLYSSLN